jgi:hypothetical protein
MQAGKTHDHGKARGQSSTTVHLNLSAGEIPADLSTHHAQAIMEVLSHPKFSILGCAGKTLNKINDFNI